MGILHELRAVLVEDALAALLVCLAEVARLPEGIRRDSEGIEGSQRNWNAPEGIRRNQRGIRRPQKDLKCHGRPPEGLRMPWKAAEGLRLPQKASEGV